MPMYVDRLPPQFERLYRYSSGATLALLATAAASILARRLAGALHTPLEPVALLAIALLVTAASTAIHVMLLKPSAGLGPGICLSLMLTTSLAVAALALGVCLPGTPTAGAFFLCTLLLAEQSWAWARYVRQASQPSPELPRDTLGATTSLSGSVQDAVGKASSFDSLAASHAGVFSDDVTQQLVRTQTADGAEQICGRLRIAFAAGQRTGSVHVAFCPPLATTPELEVEQLDGPTARIKTAQLLPYGARLDLKLAAAAEEQTCILLRFAARTIG